MPVPPVGLNPFDPAEAGGGQQPVRMQNHSQSEAAATLLPEAAVTVAIRSDELAARMAVRSEELPANMAIRSDELVARMAIRSEELPANMAIRSDELVARVASPATVAAAAPISIQTAAAQTAAAPTAVGQPAVGQPAVGQTAVGQTAVQAASPVGGAVVGQDSTLASTNGPAASPVSGLAAVPVPVVAEAQGKKTTAETPAGGVSGGVSGGVVGDVATPHGPQAASVQDLQTRPEQAKAPDANVPRDTAPRAPAAAAEPVPAEKPAAQPLKSVSLEFTPDGAREVRVRLSERAGEVHVSLHSSDPAVTKNLRDGVTDLASVLANAGYDAKAWTSGRQQQQNQQQDEPASGGRRRGSGEEAENFDSALQGSEPSLTN
jgi:hypothetical protein